jgi:RHS repeat-associated protein
VATIDPLLNRVTTVYDGASRTVATVNQLGKRTTSIFDAADHLLAQIDPLTNRTSHVYDAIGRTVADIDAMSRRTSYVFDTVGRRLASIDPLSNRASTVYDAAGRAIAAIDQLAKRTTSVFDAASRTVAQIDPLLNRTSFAYDAANRQVASINALNFRTTTVYDLVGRTLATVDPLLHRTSTFYDVAGRELATINALNQRTSTVYDAADRAIASINARGYRTTTGYDVRDAVIVTIDPLLGRTTYGYDNATRQIMVQNALGYRTSTTYLATGVTASTIDPLAGRASFSYDAASRQIAVKNALGNLTTTVYDPTGAVIANIDPLNRRTTTGYDSLSRPIVRRDALNNRTTTVYDALGRTLATVNALANRVSNTYDAAGRRIRLADANGKITTFLFDALARDTGSIDPLLRRVTFAYDAASNRTLKLDPRGNRISYTFDALNRQSTERYPTRRVTFGYDAVNNRTRLNDSTGIYTYTFDAKNRTTLAMNPDSKRITYSFDLLDRRTVVRDPDGGRFTYSHDAKDRLTTIVNPQGKRTSFTYDLIDQLTQQKHGNGSLTTNVYDAGSQKTRLINASSAGAIVNRFTYSYDNAGNRTSVVESSGDRTTWTYDATYQLKHEKRTGGTAFDVTYSYDPAGNRTWQIDSGTRTTYAFDAANQLLTQKPAGSGTTTFSYDNSGNRSQMNAAGVLTFYTWDENSQLIQAVPVASPVTLTYTGDGRRVKKNVGASVRKFIYDFEKILQETDGTNTTQKEYTSTENVYGDLLSDYTGGASTYYEFDGLGSTDALVNDAQTATDRYTYRAFGLANHTQGSTTNNDFDYVGRQGYFKDPEINLYFVRARYYDYLTGRWMSEDPLGYAAGDANLYRYVGNNPVNDSDPSGLKCDVGSSKELKALKDEVPDFKEFWHPKESQGNFFSNWLSNATDCFGRVQGATSLSFSEVARITWALKDQDLGPLRDKIKDSLETLLGQEFPPANDLPAIVGFVLKSLDNPCLRIIPGVHKLAGFAGEYGDSIVALVKKIQELYRRRNEIYNKVWKALGQEFKKLRECVATVWDKVTTVVGKLFKTVSTVAKKVFEVLSTMLLKTLEGVIDVALNKSWNDWFKDLEDVIDTVLWPWPKIGKKIDEIRGTGGALLDHFKDLEFDDAVSSLRKIAEGVVSIIDSLGLYLYIITVGLPALVGSIVPGIGNAAGGSLGQYINSIVGVILRIIRGILDALSIYDNVKSLYELVKNKIDELEDEEGQDPENENEEGEIPYVEFTDDEIVKMVELVLPIISKVFPTVVSLTLSVLGTAAGSVGRKIAQKLFSVSGEGKKKVIELVKKFCARCILEAVTGKSCFPAGTLVETEAGFKPIETIRQGERVWGRDALTGAWELAPVAETYSTEYDGDLVTIQAGGEIIVATGGHPFWVVDGEEVDNRPQVDEVAAAPSTSLHGRWVSARDLRTTDQLANRTRDPLIVEAVEGTEAWLRTYNLLVAGVHTYTVGTAGLLVHNSSRGRRKGRPPCRQTRTPKGKKAKAKRKEERTQRNKEQIKGSSKDLIEKEKEILENRVQRAGKTGQRVQEKLAEEAQQALEELRKKRQGG